jgi:hypothetical protein
MSNLGYEMSVFVCENIFVVLAIKNTNFRRKEKKEKCTF